VHCSVTRPHAEVAVVLKIVGHVSKGLAYAWRRWGKHFCAQNSHIVKHFISKTLFLVVKYRYYMHRSITRPHAEVDVVLNIAGHVSKGLAKVGEAIVRQRIVYFKSFYIKNPIFSSKVPLLTNQDGTSLFDTSMYT
jgi:hypothetical protein